MRANGSARSTAESTRSSNRATCSRSSANFSGRYSGAPDRGCALLQGGFAYFANSYRLTSLPPGWRGAWADHGGRFVAALERGAVLACQFHPELSGAFGHDLLRRWLALGADGGGGC